MFYINRRTAEDIRKAIGYYEEAIRLDPGYALAYARLSIAAINLATTYGGLPPKEKEELIAKARASAKRALELDPNLANAHSAQGTILRTWNSITSPRKRNTAALSSSRRSMRA